MSAIPVIVHRTIVARPLELKNPVGLTPESTRPGRRGRYVQGYD